MNPLMFPILLLLTNGEAQDDTDQPSPLTHANMNPRDTDPATTGVGDTNIARKPE